jgi:hypothetical protein
MSRAFAQKLQQGSRLCVKMLQMVGILKTSEEILTDAVGRTCSREHLLNMELYSEIAKVLIPDLKLVYSASGMNSLRPNAEVNQKAPLINLMRQILRANGLNLTPKSELNGYYPNGQKRIYRWFEITTDSGFVETRIEMERLMKEEEEREKRLEQIREEHQKKLEREAKLRSKEYYLNIPLNTRQEVFLENPRVYSDTIQEKEPVSAPETMKEVPERPVLSFRIIDAPPPV